MLKFTVESGKKNFVGSELPSKTLGVIGLGAIGFVLRAALSLGMSIGYDPLISVQSAWRFQVSRGCEYRPSFQPMRRNFCSCSTAGCDAWSGKCRTACDDAKGGVLINLARGGICDDEAVLAALDSGQLHSYD